jgi:hypothetical protein|tara:strand:+ start:101 stop:325 length:225 start_codon:yes stop_codon:yes gene_type:complete
MLERGTQVIGVWGAMVPESHGYICSMEDTNQGTEVDIMWNNGSVHHVMLDDIQVDYLESNQVGFYVNPFTKELM